MFTIDGVPMLFSGNEIGDADERHSMFGKTPMDWSQLDSEVGKKRHALVRRLAALRKEHHAFTEVNGIDGLVWLDTTQPNEVSAFVRRCKGETLLVVQNWTGKEVSAEVSFAVSASSLPSYLAQEKVDRDVKGTIADKILLSNNARKTGSRAFTLGPWGYAILPIK
jgi:1,4-alpha-glucan branching enzyme